MRCGEEQLQHAPTIIVFEMGTNATAVQTASSKPTNAQRNFFQWAHETTVHLHLFVVENEATRVTVATTLRWHIFLPKQLPKSMTLGSDCTGR